MDDIFADNEELEKAPILERKGKEREWGRIEKSITPKAIYIKAMAKNGLFLNFEVEEIRLFQGKNTAVLKPIGFRKYPWFIYRQYKQDIVLDDAVIPSLYKEQVERMLEVEEAPAGVVKRGRAGGDKGHLPMREYILPLLESLAEMGGRGRARDVLDRIYQKLKDRLTDGDRSYRQSGQIVWVNNAQWVRFKLVKQGYLRNDTPTGIWELTDEGWRYLKELKRRQESGL